MKKRSILVVCLVMVMALVCMSFAGCSSSEPKKTEDPVSTEGTEGNEGTTTTAGKKIIFFESNISGLTAKDVNGVQAYSFSEFVQAKLSAPTGAVKIVATDGYATDKTVEELANAHITLVGDTAPTFVDVENAAKYILYMDFGTEVIYFVQSDFKFEDVITKLGLPETATYTFTASDGFSWPAADFEDAKKSEVKGPATTGASVNVFCYSMGDAGADLRDCIYVTVE